MRRLTFAAPVPAFALALAFALTIPAHATKIVNPPDTLETLTFNGVTLQDQNSDPVNGYIVFDITSGTVSSADFTVDGDTFGGFFQQFAGSDTYLFFEVANGDSFRLFLPVSTLVGYSGGNICSVDYTTGCGSDVSAFIPNTADPPVLAGSLLATPEPSGFVLLGSGILSVAAASRRRLFKRRSSHSSASAVAAVAEAQTD